MEILNAILNGHRRKKKLKELEKKLKGISHDQNELDYKLNTFLEILYENVDDDELVKKTWNAFDLHLLAYERYVSEEEWSPDLSLWHIMMSHIENEMRNLIKEKIQREVKEEKDETINQKLARRKNMFFNLTGTEWTSTYERQPNSHINLYLFQAYRSKRIKRFYEEGNE